MRTLWRLLFARPDLETLASRRWAVRSGLAMGVVLATINTAWRAAEGRRDWGPLAVAAGLVVAWSVAVQLCSSWLGRRRLATLRAPGRRPLSDRDDG
jgi:hypothetical protein